MKRMQNSLGKSKTPDIIQEEPWWNIVISELNAISKDFSSSDCWQKIEAYNYGKQLSIDKQAP